MPRRPRPAPSRLGSIMDIQFTDQDQKDREYLYGLDINGDPNRSSQRDAGYRTGAGMLGHTCADCVFFQSATAELGLCQKVRGIIEAADYCTYFTDRDGIRDYPEHQSAPGPKRKEKTDGKAASY